MPDIYHCTLHDAPHCANCQPVVLCDLDGAHCEDTCGDCRACRVERGGWAA